MLDPQRGVPIRQALLCAVLGVGIILGLMSLGGLIPYDDPAFADYDHHSYLAMAEGGLGAPGKASAPPFCWRILTPLIAGALPFPAPRAFFVLSLLFIASSALAVQILLSRRGLSRDLSLLGEVIFLSFFWAVGYNLWNYLMVDPLSLLILIAGLIVLEEESLPGPARTILLSALITLGALNKESYLLLAVAAAVHLWRSSRSDPVPSRIARAILPAIPGVVAMLLVRLSIHGDAGQMKEFASYDLPGVFRTMVLARLREIPRWGAEVFVDPWGPIVLAPLLLHPVRSLRWAREHPHLTILAAGAVAQTFFGTSGGRLVILAAPAAILFCTSALEEDLGPAIPGRRAIVALMALQFLFQYLRRTTLGLSLPPYAPNSLVSAAYLVRASALLAAICIWFVAERGRRDRGRSRVDLPAAGA